MNQVMHACLVGLVVLTALTAQGQEPFACPDGARPNGEATPEVRESWGELTLNGSVVMHGPYRSWWPNGTLGNSGQYDRGKAVGKWSAWFPSGKLQAEEWFEDGQRTRARYWNEEGLSVPSPQSSAEPPVATQ